jgi:hypothetical protein
MLVTWLCHQKRTVGASHTLIPKDARGLVLIGVLHTYGRVSPRVRSIEPSMRALRGQEARPDTAHEGAVDPYATPQATTESCHLHVEGGEGLNAGQWGIWQRRGPQPPLLLLLGASMRCMAMNG